MKSHLEQIIRARLAIQKKSIRALSKELDVSRVTIYNLFQGKYSRKLLHSVSEVIDVPVHILMVAGSVEDMNDAMAIETKELLEAYYASSAENRKVAKKMLETKALAYAEGEKPKLIVVDDIQDNVDLLVRVLRKDFEVLQFTDPAKALEAAKNEEVLAVITDQRMPGMKGTDLLTQVKKLNKPIARFLVSGYTDSEALMDAINHARADAFISKPIDATEFRSRMQSLLSSQNTLMH